MAQYRFKKSIACLPTLSLNIQNIQRICQALEGGRRLLQHSARTNTVRRTRNKTNLSVIKEITTSLTLSSS